MSEQHSEERSRHDEADMITQRTSVREALGAGLGGNLTLVAASANVYVAGVAERAGYRISFLEFLKWGGLVTLASLVLATVYLWLRYLL